MTELWANYPIGSYYWVSSKGRVRSSRSQKVLVPAIVNGYPRISIYVEGKKHGICVHRMVLQAFKGPAPAGYEAAHLDGIRANPSLDNLIWATRKANHQHKRLHGTFQCGEKATHNKLTEESVRLIRTEPAPDKVWAARLGVRWQTIRNARQGRAWAHVDTPPFNMRPNARIRDRQAIGAAVGHIHDSIDSPQPSLTSRETEGK